jgi:hypothetical protein
LRQPLSGYEQQLGIHAKQELFDLPFVAGYIEAHDSSVQQMRSML